MSAISKTASKTASKSKSGASEASDPIDPMRNPRNEVFLEGRVSNQPQERVLPSGDVVVQFRVVIDRSQNRGKKREVDTLDIAVWSAATRKRALRLSVDDWVSIDGAVRRRFWQAPTGLASRWQVEASQLRKL